jgi:hypothetical protein
MMISRRRIGASLAMVTIGLAACGGGGNGDDAAATPTAPTTAVSVSPTTTSQPTLSTTTQAPATTQAPTTTQATTTTPSPITTTTPSPITTTPAAIVPLMPTPSCPSAGAAGSAPNSNAPLVCLERFGGLRWGAVVQTDLSDEVRQALTACADELTDTLASIGLGNRFALPRCDAATNAVSTSGSEPYVALIHQQLADCRVPLDQYASDQRAGVAYDAPKAEALVNGIVDCQSVIMGFATTRP